MPLHVAQVHEREWLRAQAMSKRREFGPRYAQIQHSLFARGHRMWGLKPGSCSMDPSHNLGGMRGPIELEDCMMECARSERHRTAKPTIAKA